MSRLTHREPDPDENYTNLIVSGTLSFANNQSIIQDN